MNYQELAQIVKKKPATVAVFFSRHQLSIKSVEDINFYLQQIKSKKRLESGKRCADHLKPYQFKKNKYKIQRARQLVLNRQLIWYSDPEKLSINSIVEHVLSYGDFSDFQEILKILGKNEVKKIFMKQIQKPKTNYRPATINFFTHYFHLNAS